MGENISYDYIWNLCQKEKQTNQLLPLGRNFYADIQEYMSKSALTSPQKENMEKILLNLFEKRKQKLFLYMAYNKQPPSQLDATESDFYTRLLEITTAYRIDKGNEIKSNKLLRSITDIPEIVLPSGKKIGPLKKDEILDMNNSAADITYLISNAICENYTR
jgi:DNA replication initiation complex subunit (GINS family)